MKFDFVAIVYIIVLIAAFLLIGSMFMSLGRYITKDSRTQERQFCLDNHGKIDSYEGTLFLTVYCIKDNVRYQTMCNEKECYFISGR